MSDSRYTQAKQWAGLIGDAVKLCFDQKPTYDDTSFFDATGQALKVKLGHMEQKTLVNVPTVLDALVEPFFAETSYPFDVKTKVKDEDATGRGKKTRVVWEPGGTRSVPSIYDALQELADARPLDTALQDLIDRIETLAGELPDDLKEAHNLLPADEVDAAAALSTSATVREIPEHVS